MSRLKIRYTRLGAAFANKLGRASFEEVARGEIGERVALCGLVLRELTFHNIEFHGTWFMLVPDGQDGVLVDAAIEEVRFNGWEGRDFTLLSGASLDDDEHAAALRSARKFWSAS